MAEHWFVERKGRSAGPFTRDQLRQLAAKGTLKAADQVRKDAADPWVRADQVLSPFPDVVAADDSPFAHLGEPPPGHPAHAGEHHHHHHTPPPPTGRVIAIAVAGTGLLIAVLFGVWWMVNTRRSAEADQLREAAVAVTAEQLATAYADNEDIADAAYKGKWLRLTGRVHDMGKHSVEEVHLEIVTGNPAVGLQCSFADRFANRIKQVRKGQEVTVIGRCAGKPTYVLLEDCQFAE